MRNVPSRTEQDVLPGARERFGTRVFPLRAQDERRAELRCHQGRLRRSRGRPSPLTLVARWHRRGTARHWSGITLFTGRPRMSRPSLSLDHHTPIGAAERHRRGPRQPRCPHPRTTRRESAREGVAIPSPTPGAGRPAFPPSNAPTREIAAVSSTPTRSWPSPSPSTCPWCVLSSPAR